MASGTIKGTKQGYFGVEIDYSSTPDSSTNKSTVVSKVYITYYSINISARSSGVSNVNGVSKTFNTSSINHNAGGAYRRLVCTQTETVEHNTNGSKSITISASFPFNLNSSSSGYVGTLSASATVDLDNIPRASTFTIPASMNTGSSLSVSITKASSSYRHRVELLIDGAQKYISDYFTANSASYSIPHSWIPNHPNRTMTVKLYTYTSSGTSAIGTATKTIKVDVPSNIMPSVTLEGALVNGLGGYYVQGKSSIALVATGNAGDGATVTNYTFYGPNINGANSSITQTSNSITSSIIADSGSKSYYVRITDSRGRYVDSAATSIIVYPYATPSIKVSSIQRCLQNGVLNQSGTYASYKISGNWSTVNGANTRTVTVAYSSDGGTSYSTETTIANASDTNVSLSGTFGAGSLNISSSYKIKFVITDTYTNSNIVVDLGTAERPINFAQYGNGIAIGGMSTVVSSLSDGLFENNWDSIFYNDLYVGSDKTLANKISGLAKCATRMLSGDLNSVCEPGVYTVTSSVLNVPSSAAYTVVVFPYSLSSTTAATNKYMAQIAITSGSATSNSLYVRHSYDEGQWTSWLRVADNGDLANYLPLSGGTLTGTLVTNNHISFGNNGAAIKVSSDTLSSGSAYARTIEMGNNNGSGDRYYIQVDSYNNLKTGTRLNNASNITWRNMTHVRRGTCTLNSSSATTITFSSNMPSTPTVILTPFTTETGVIAAKIRSITTSGFAAIIGGSVSGSIQFSYLAVWN